MAGVGENTGSHIRMETPNSQAWTRRCGGPPCHQSHEIGPVDDDESGVEQDEGRHGPRQRSDEPGDLGMPDGHICEPSRCASEHQGGITSAMTMCSTMCTVNRDVSPMSWIGQPETSHKADCPIPLPLLARCRRWRIGGEHRSKPAVGVPIPEGEGEASAQTS